MCKDIFLLLFEQMVFENPKTGRVYQFDVNGRIIRDDEFDGWNEFPVKVNAEGSDGSTAKGESDAEAKSLPGKTANNNCGDIVSGVYWRDKI